MHWKCVCVAVHACKPVSTQETEEDHTLEARLVYNSELEANLVHNETLSPTPPKTYTYKQVNKPTA